MFLHCWSENTNDKSLVNYKFKKFLKINQKLWFYNIFKYRLPISLVVLYYRRTYTPVQQSTPTCFLLNKIKNNNYNNKQADFLFQRLFFLLLSTMTMCKKISLRIPFGAALVLLLLAYFLYQFSHSEKQLLSFMGVW